MAYFNAEAEPFEEIQGNRAPKASADELNAFYKEMEKGDLQRKLSKRKSGSLWSRKSLRRTSTSQSHHQPPPAPPQLASPSTSSLARPPPLRTISDHDRGESADAVPPMPPMPVSRSIIPDRLQELPTWYRDNANPSARYPMHNPVGPRWYKNHHLIPPASARPSGRPPSVFSPSFPAMPPGDRSDVSLNHSASNSPLPTPDSSQTRMEGVPRSRKTSQTAHDNVDLLDGSDPWGTAWHHESPYDVGGLNNNSNPASLDEHSPTNAHNPHTVPRSRTSSATAQNRRKTVTPSPLSQSTSAVHLQVPEGSQPTRKLSKRRTVGLFGRGTTSAPSSPVDEPNSRGASPAHLGPPSSFVAVTAKKERRGSVLGRFAKRFSISRKPATVSPMEVVRQPSPEKRQPSPEKMHQSDLKRVPPPPLAHQDSSFVVIPPPHPEPEQVEVDRTSSISLEAELPYTMGRLTIANPDPGSAESTPVQRELSLPPEDRERMVEHERSATGDTITSGHQGAQSPMSFRDSRSLQPIASSSSVLVENVVQQTRSPSPPPPPAPEKSSEGSSNGHHRREFSGSRTPVDRTSSALSNRPLSSLVMQSPQVSHRLLEKPQPAPPPPPPKLPVPFPSNAGRSSGEQSHQPQEMTADISPLSTSSMLVNPPTPYTKDMLMPDEPEPAPPPVPPKRSSRDPSPSQVSVTARETETFKLVRSSSGNVYASSETIRAAGEQWEVVESTSKGKNRSQDRESENRKEQRRQARAEKEAESEQPKVRSERSRKRRSVDDSAERHRHRLPIPDTLVSPQEEPRGSGSKRDEDREQRRERKEQEREQRRAERKDEEREQRKAADLKLDKPQPAPPAPSRTLERNPSKSARPISEVPTAADMNMMKAREAWDMDRLWKARSMSGMEANGVNAAPITPPHVPVPNGRNAQDPPTIYGSSHTAFAVSAPFQQPSSSPIYHSMPNGPPPVVYPPGYATPNGYSNTNNRASPLSDVASSKSTSPRAPLANPLPEPPRESPYEPAPLSWSKHATSVTTH
ncbi:hypothetical protein C8R47DRAFT_1007333 [Mycena vitilis]|nr:hypothetical protein C8R47DRAFT_1007333 [Mycena vitilis]